MDDNEGELLNRLDMIIKLLTLILELMLKRTGDYK
jgi:hypothetical protein